MLGRDWGCGEGVKRGRGSEEGVRGYERVWRGCGGGVERVCRGCRRCGEDVERVRSGCGEGVERV